MSAFGCVVGFGPQARHNNDSERIRRDMAKTPKSEGKKPLAKPKSTTGRARSTKSVASNECEGCCCCQGKPAWSVPFCEDDNCNYRSPPNIFACFVFDPSRSPQVGPYWEKPANFPANELLDLWNAMVSSLSQPSVAALWSLLINNMSTTDKSNLAAAIVNNLQCNPMCSCGENTCTCTATMLST